MSSLPLKTDRMETGSLVADPTARPRPQTQGANRIALTYSDVPRAVLDETFYWHGCGAARFNLILPLLTHRCFIRYLGPYWRSCGITLHPRHPSPVPSDPTNNGLPPRNGYVAKMQHRWVYTPLFKNPRHIDGEQRWSRCLPYQKATVIAVVIETAHIYNAGRMKYVRNMSLEMK